LRLLYILAHRRTLKYFADMGDDEPGTDAKDATWLNSEAEQFLVSKNTIHLFRKEGQTDRAAVSSFLNQRPDELAIRQHRRQIALLEFTRAMDQDEEYQSRKRRALLTSSRLHPVHIREAVG